MGRHTRQRILQLRYHPSVDTVEKGALEGQSDRSGRPTKVHFQQSDQGKGIVALALRLVTKAEYPLIPGTKCLDL